MSYVLFGGFGVNNVQNRRLFSHRSAAQNINLDAKIIDSLAALYIPMRPHGRPYAGSRTFFC